MKFQKGDKVEVLRQIEPEIWRKGVVLRSYWGKYSTIILESQVKVEAVKRHVRAA